MKHKRSILRSERDLDKNFEEDPEHNSEEDTLEKLMYVSRFGQVVKVIPCSPQTSLPDTYIHNLIQQIESMN